MIKKLVALFLFWLQLSAVLTTPEKLLPLIQADKFENTSRPVLAGQINRNIMARFESQRIPSIIAPVIPVQVGPRTEELQAIRTTF